MRGKKLLFYLPLSLLTTNGPEEVVLHVFFIFCISHFDHYFDEQVPDLVNFQNR